MQNIATKVFIYASVAFGILGIFMVFSGIDPGDEGTSLELVISKLFMSSVFIILSSFALSVASKYLKDRS